MSKRIWWSAATIIVCAGLTYLIFIFESDAIRELKRKRAACGGKHNDVVVRRIPVNSPGAKNWRYDCRNEK